MRTSRRATRSPSGEQGLFSKSDAMDSYLPAHEAHEAEWWYVHGHLDGLSCRLAFHLAFFRHHTDRLRAGGFFPIRWLGAHLRFAHFAITDLNSGLFHFSHRRSIRSGAGASKTPFQVWHGDWSLTLKADGYQLTASLNDIRMELDLHPQKPLFLLPRAAAANDCSAYVSCPRLHALGRVWKSGQSFDAQGSAWLDHEWGNLGMNEKRRHGWDWFGLHLENGAELVVYQMRAKPHAVTETLAGLIEPDGRFTRIPADRVRVRPLAWTRSPRTGIVYPVSWRIGCEDHNLELQVDARLRSHELDTRGSTSVLYWEGPVAVRGRLRGHPSTGRGFAELTGHDPVQNRLGIFDFEKARMTLAGGLANEWRFLRHGTGETHSNDGWPLSGTKIAPRLPR